MVIPDRAAKLYERTWDRFNEMLSFIPTMTLRSQSGRGHAWNLEALIIN